MRVWTVFWLVVVAVVAIFAIANWHVLTAPTTIHLVLADVTAPLGLTMLGAMVGLTLLFLLFLVWLETKTLVGLGGASRASQQPAGVAIGELRAELDREFSGLREETSQSMRDLLARLDDLERAVTRGVKRPDEGGGLR
jgi:hypothetical protein